MQNRYLLSLFGLAVVSLASFAAADSTPSKSKTTPAMDKKAPLMPVPKEPLKISPAPSPTPRPGVLPRVGCPDPAVALRVGWPARNMDGTYTFRLLATVTNQGSAPFRSRRAQTGISIGEGPRVLHSGTWASPALNTIELTPGAGTSNVVLVSNWSPTSEFLADFTAQISYDPDIRLDGNLENDDCNASNNMARLTVADVRRVLEALPR